MFLSERKPYDGLRPTEGFPQSCTLRPCVTGELYITSIIFGRMLGEGIPTFLVQDETINFRTSSGTADCSLCETVCRRDARNAVEIVNLSWETNIWHFGGVCCDLSTANARSLLADLRKCLSFESEPVKSTSRAPSIPLDSQEYTPKREWINSAAFSL